MSKVSAVKISSIGTNDNGSRVQKLLDDEVARLTSFEGRELRGIDVGKPDALLAKDLESEIYE